MIKEMGVLKVLDCESVLQFVMHLKKFFSTHRHAALPWIQVIGDELMPVIWARYKLVFSSTAVRTIDHVTGQQMVKVL
jgi:hypothetical protein